VSAPRTRGSVTVFDAVRGDGVVTTELGESLYFHCVTIADGSRVVPLGAQVSGIRAVGRLGEDEIEDLRQE
jgi:cold shock CspA family protein